MRRWAWSGACAVLGVVGFLACSSEDKAPAPTYPAFPFSLPVVVDNGGPKMKSPKLVVFVDPDDPQKADVVAALEYLRTSDYWSATTAEYGIGPIASVEVRDPPVLVPFEVTQDGLANLVAQYARDTRFGGGGPPDAAAPDDDAGVLPAPPANAHDDVLYLVVLPQTTHIPELACAVGGYHYHVAATAADDVPFAITRSDCPSSVTPVEALVHEIVEAVTDPFFNRPALYYVDVDHGGWTAGNSTEVADLCVGLPAQFDTNPPPVGAGTGRPLAFPTVWSNRLAKLGQDPCVPKSATSPRALTVATAVTSDKTALNDYVEVPGVNLALGGVLTVPIQVASNRPTDPVEVFAGDMAALYGQAELDVSLDRKHASNGDTVNMTITRRALPPNPQYQNASVVAVIAKTLAGDSFTTYLTVGVPR